MGVATFFRLMREHGSADAALDALPRMARGAGERDYRACPPDIARAELDAGRKAGAQAIFFGSAAYPARLAEIADPPPLLWVVGDPAILLRPMIALVGARNASSLGIRMARALAQGLGEAGYVTASGLARGIDTAVHHASLGTGTVAVTAGGVDVVYPAENAALAAQIAACGARLSEQPIGLQPMARHFPRRNRIISGLARAVVVVEAAPKSGSLITAREALEQGREVMAVPGHPFDARAAGCNLLIRDGAILVRGPRDVCEALDAMTPPPRPARPRRSAPAPAPARRSDPVPAPAGEPAAALERRILERLGPSPCAEDQLIRDLGRPTAEVTAAIVTLEIEGRLQRHPGGLLSAPGDPTSA